MDTGTISSFISGIVLLSVAALYVLMRQVHKLVNSAMSQQKDRVEFLERQVEALGGQKAPPPRDQSAE